MMKTYIGTKIILAEPETKDGEDGYKVQYEDGYVSWSPKDVFEIAYSETDKNLSFGDATFFLKKGYRVARKGWNGKGMWLSLSRGSVVPSAKFWSPHNARFAKENGGEAEVLDVITMKTADDKILIEKIFVIFKPSSHINISF
jgi:hypothetical protein